MLFNFGKCKCLHTGHGNLDINYNMGNTVLGTTVKEKDLGMTIFHALRYVAASDLAAAPQLTLMSKSGQPVMSL